jgi:YgiT-type zinc finger domain-containing protein
MKDERDICPLCGSEMTDKIIDYSDWSDGHLLVVRDVPVRECQAAVHRFFQARVARALERLFELDRQHKLEPIETMEVPVVKLELAA